MNLLVKVSIFIVSFSLISCSSHESKSNADLDEIETIEISKIYEPSKNFDNHNKVNLSPKKIESYSNEKYTYRLYSEDSLELARTTINISLDFADGRLEIINTALNNSSSTNHWSLKINDTWIDSYQCKGLIIQRLNLTLKVFQKYTKVKRIMNYNKNKGSDKVVEITTKPDIHFSHIFQWEFILPTKNVILTDRELNKSNGRDIIKRKYKLEKDNLYRINRDISQNLNSGIYGKIHDIGKEEDVFIIRQNGVKLDSLIFNSNKRKNSNEFFCSKEINLDS